MAESSGVHQQLRPYVKNNGQLLQARCSFRPRISSTGLPLFSLTMAMITSMCLRIAPSAAQTIVGGYGFTCSLVANPFSGVRCWGVNARGQLGIGNASVPYLDSPPSSSIVFGASGLSAFDSHVCAVVYGSLACWGSNMYGELGIGTFSSFEGSPQDVSLNASVQAVAVGSGFTCVIVGSVGGVRCWGVNSAGQLGNGDPSHASVSAPPSSDVITGVAALVAGGSHVCVVMAATRGVRCWGQTDSGQTGSGDTGEPCSGAKPVTCLSVLSPPTSDLLTNPVLTVSAGESHTCILTNSSDVLCWGSNRYQQVGAATTANNEKVLPPDVVVTTNVTSLSCGHNHNCVVLSESNKLRCWGQNAYGQLGNPALAHLANASHSDPYIVGLSFAYDDADANQTDPLTKVLKSMGGFGHACAVLTGSYDVKCWGRNVNGELGLGYANDTVVSDPNTPTVIVLIPAPHSTASGGGVHMITVVVAAVVGAGGAGIVVAIYAVCTRRNKRRNRRHRRRHGSEDDDDDSSDGGHRQKRSSAGPVAPSDVLPETRPRQQRAQSDGIEVIVLASDSSDSACSEEGVPHDALDVRAVFLVNTLWIPP